MTTLTNIPRARVEFGPGALLDEEADMQTNRADVVDAWARSLAARKRDVRADRNNRNRISQQHGMGRAMKHDFPHLASQRELDAEARRAAMLERAARVAEFFALGALLFAPLVFGEAAIATLIEAFGP